MVTHNYKTDGIHRIDITDEMLNNGEFERKCIFVKEGFHGGGLLIPVSYREEKNSLSFAGILLIIVPKNFPRVRVIFCLLKEFPIFDWIHLFPDAPIPKGLAPEQFRRIEADSSLTIAEMDQLISAPEPEYLWKVWI